MTSLSKVCLHWTAGANMPCEQNLDCYHFLFDKNGKAKPLLVWENLEILLKRKGITLKYNELSKSIEYFGTINSSLNNNATLEDTISKLRSI